MQLGSLIKLCTNYILFIYLRRTVLLIKHCQNKLYSNSNLREYIILIISPLIVTNNILMLV